MNRRLVIYLSISIAAVALIGGIIVLAVIGSLNQPVESAATPDEAVTESVTAAPQSTATSAPSSVETAAVSSAANTDADAPSQAATDAPTDQEAAEETKPVEISAPKQLTRLLKANATTPQKLYEAGCTQLVVVRAEGASAMIEYYTVTDNEWTLNEDMSCSGFVGSNGVTYDMHEGGYATPIGLYSVGDAFYINEKPETGLNSFQITPDTYWVDDPDSRYYNQRIEGIENMDWDSAEHMIDYYDAYEYGFVINYNTAAEYNKGSAIFLHVSGGPTAGCVGTSRHMVLEYLRVLDAAQNPYILIA